MPASSNTIGQRTYLPRSGTEHTDQLIDARRNSDQGIAPRIRSTLYSRHLVMRSKSVEKYHGPKCHKKPEVMSVWWVMCWQSVAQRGLHVAFFLLPDLHVVRGIPASPVPHHNLDSPSVGRGRIWV